MPRSSSGLGRRPLTPVTRVQIPYGVPQDCQVHRRTGPLHRALGGGGLVVFAARQGHVRRLPPGPGRAARAPSSRRREASGPRAGGRPGPARPAPGQSRVRAGSGPGAPAVAPAPLGRRPRTPRAAGFRGARFRAGPKLPLNTRKRRCELAICSPGSGSLLLTGQASEPRSSSGLGRRPLTPVTRVQIPYGVPRIARTPLDGVFLPPRGAFVSGWRRRRSGAAGAGGGPGTVACLSTRRAG